MATLSVCSCEYELSNKKKVIRYNNDVLSFNPNNTDVLNNKKIFGG